MGKRSAKGPTTAATSVLPVARYVRMSTDHQRYSTENQAQVIDDYARSHGMLIVRTYADEGKSGLSFAGREGLQRLIRDVQDGNCDFGAILVYDISRWGRFQDADESAYYEYLCRRAGIRVLYCAEPFENDGSPMAVIMKSVKRAMAGEYSRELSTKVFIGQCRLIELGFHQGGVAGYGLRRLLINEQRQPKGELTWGERKSLQTDRVVLSPGPADEIAIVRQIYRRFVEDRRNEREIAQELNQAGVLTDRNTPWSRGTVHQVLTNEKYVGNNVYNRTSFKLKLKRVRNPPDMWVRADAAFTGIVESEVFSAAHELIAERSVRYDDVNMIERLRGLRARFGVLSGLLIDEQEDMPSSSAYRARFGSLLRAYSLVGFMPERDYRYVEINRELRTRRPHVVATIVHGFESVGANVKLNPQVDLLIVNGEFSVSVVLSRCILKGEMRRWRLRFDTGLSPDLTVAVRMAPGNEQILDYYLFPCIDLPIGRLQLGESNSLDLDAYRFDRLESLYALAERVPISCAA